VSDDTLTTVQSEGFTVTTNSETSEQIAANEAPKEAPEAEKPEKETPPKVAKAAAELGKLGGAASAAKRAEAKAAETPEEPEPAPEPEPEKDTEKPLGKPRDDPRARMLEATRKEAEAKRQAAALAERAERAERRLAELEKGKPAEEPKRPAADEKPKAEDFEDYADFVEARSRWAAREEFRTAQRAAAVQAQAQNYVQKLDGVVSKYNERLAKATEGDPDFMGKLSPEVSELRPTFTLEQGQRPGPLNLIADEILSSEHAPALMLHLSEHPDVFQRIAALRTPPEVLREMAKLEARLDAAPTATVSRAEVSKAHAPVRPVAGAPHTADQVPGDDASYEDHKRYWNARDKQASRR
jgi:hypothetical protein